MVVRQSHLGEARSLYGCQRVPIGRDNYPIRLMSLFVHMVAAAVDTLCELESDRSYLGTRPGILASTCKAFDFWLCNPSVSGRGGSGPCRPSGMPRECTWITAREEACSEGGCTSYIQLLGATAIDDLLASEQVVWTFFIRVGV